MTQALQSTLQGPMCLQEGVELLGAAWDDHWDCSCCMDPATGPATGNPTFFLSSVQILATGQSLFTRDPHHRGGQVQCVGRLSGIVRHVAGVMLALWPLLRRRRRTTTTTVATAEEHCGFTLTLPKCPPPSRTGSCPRTAKSQSKIQPTYNHQRCSMKLKT